MKCVPPYGLQLLQFTAQMTASGAAATATLIVPGQSGLPTDDWHDVYGITITTDDTTVQHVQITEGTLTLDYYVSATEPVNESAPVAWRFTKGKTIYANVATITSGKHFSLLLRGVRSKT